MHDWHSFHLKTQLTNIVIGLRIYGAAPSLLERKTPTAEDPFNIAGYALPPDTIVAAQVSPRFACVLVDSLTVNS